jgi:hypothetical protein
MVWAIGVRSEYRFLCMRASGVWRHLVEARDFQCASPVGVPLFHVRVYVYAYACAKYLLHPNPNSVVSFTMPSRTLCIPVCTYVHTHAHTHSHSIDSDDEVGEEASPGFEIPTLSRAISFGNQGDEEPDDFDIDC